MEVDEEEEEGGAPSLPLDALVLIFGTFLADTPEGCRTLWRDVPLVCRGWAYARTNGRLKTILVQRVWPKRAKEWDIEKCVKFHDALQDFRMLRLPFQTAVATTVAYSRLDGVGWPELHDYEDLFKPDVWTELALKRWRHPEEAVDFIEGRIKGLQQCWQVIMNPPTWAFLDEVVLPEISVLSGVFGTHAWPILAKLLGQLELAVQHAIGLEVPELPSSSDQCFVCDKIMVSSSKRGQVMRENDKHGYGTQKPDTCKRHGRMWKITLDALFDLDEDLRRAVKVWVDHSGDFALVRPFPTERGCDLVPIKTLGPEDLWWPPVEIECQQICARMVDPEDGIMRLSSSGLRCLLEDSNSGIITAEFLQQTQMAHTMTSTAPLEDEDLIPSEDLYMNEGSNDEEMMSTESSATTTSADGEDSSEWSSIENN